MFIIKTEKTDYLENFTVSVVLSVKIKEREKIYKCLGLASELKKDCGL